MVRRAGGSRLWNASAIEPGKRLLPIRPGDTDPGHARGIRRVSACWLGTCGCARDRVSDDFLVAGGDPEEVSPRRILASVVEEVESNRPTHFHDDAVQAPGGAAVPVAGEVFGSPR